MTGAYSEDLRERAVARFAAGETIRAIGVLRAQMSEAKAGDRPGCAEPADKRAAPALPQS